LYIKRCKNAKMEIIFIDNIGQDCYNKVNLRETLGMSLVMQAKPKSAELILVFLH